MSNQWVNKKEIPGIKKIQFEFQSKTKSVRSGLQAFSAKLLWLTSCYFDFQNQLLYKSCNNGRPNSHSLPYLTSFFTGMSTMSLILAMGRRWWRATQTSRSMTTTGTTWWCPGTPTTYIHSRLTHAPLLSTPMEPATWTSKVKAGRLTLTNTFFLKALPLTGNNYSSVILGLSFKCCWKVAMIVVWLCAGNGISKLFPDWCLLMKI